MNRVKRRQRRYWNGRRFCQVRLPKGETRASDISRGTQDKARQAMGAFCRSTVQTRDVHHLVYPEYIIRDGEPMEPHIFYFLTHSPVPSSQHGRDSPSSRSRWVAGRRYTR